MAWNFMHTEYKMVWSSNTQCAQCSFCIVTDAKGEKNERQKCKIFHIGFFISILFLFFKSYLGIHSTEMHFNCNIAHCSTDKRHMLTQRSERVFRCWNIPISETFLRKQDDGNQILINISIKWMIPMKCLNRFRIS